MESAEASHKVAEASQAKPINQARRAHPCQLIRNASAKELVVLTIGTTFAAGQGIAAPLFALAFGGTVHVTSAHGGLASAMASVLRLLAILGTTNFLCAITWQASFNWFAARQAARMRIKYFEAVLTRDLAWFDQNEPATLPTRMAVEIQTIQDAMGPRAGELVVNLGLICSGVTVAFVKGWQLTLVICAAFPVYLVVGLCAASVLEQGMGNKQDYYGRAGAVAEEALAAIRTVAAFGCEQHEARRYEAQLKLAKRGGIKVGIQLGAAFGLLLGITSLQYALAFWFGAHRIVVSSSYTGADVITVIMALLMGVGSLCGLSTPMITLAQGMASASKMMAVLEASPEIEPVDDASTELPRAAATIERIEFKDVRFSYPARPDIQVLQNLQATIFRGQKVAFVGESGSGKSTALQLLERFYDPQEGQVLVNGVPLCELPVYAWRRALGYVGQEPVLFATSARENIRGGDASITDEQVESAAEQAHIFSFLRAMPKGLDTFVGAAGCQMSGGQKQRIAIARALARRPQVLLLDEATSALDNDSESQVQGTLDRLQGSAEAGLTVISVAHRLSTIRNADVIFVFKSGSVVEYGPHAELMGRQGEYFSLVQSQTSGNMERNSQHDLRPEAASPRVTTPHNAIPRVPTQHSEYSYGPVVERINTGVSQFSAALDLSRMPLPGQGALGAAATGMTSAVLAPSADSPRSSGSSSSRQAPETDAERLKGLGKYQAPRGRLLRLSRPEWALYPLAFLGALASGAIMPLQGFLFSGALASFYVWPVEEMEEQIHGWCLLLVFVGIGALSSEMLKTPTFTYIQECLTARLRVQAFSSALQQEIGFFDDPKSGSAGMAATLERQASRVSQMTGSNLGNAASAVCAMFVGVALGLLGSWQLSLLIMGLVPVLAGVMVLVTAFSHSAADGQGLDDAGAVAAEAVANIRTVRALRSEAQPLGLYSKAVQRVASRESMTAFQRGLAYAFSSSSIYLIYIVSFWYGARLVDRRVAEPAGVYQSLLGIVFGCVGASMAASFAPDAARGRLAAHDIFRLVDRESQIDAVQPRGNVKELGDGSIEFQKVLFCFPHRPGQLVLQGLSFRVEAGQSVALVGPSGGGKSTVIQLLQRFYDPKEGSVKVGGADLRSLDVAWWRRQLGFVGQEPVLFDVSLEENVRYGCPEATSEQLHAAAVEANLDFVLDGRLKWEDSLGLRGERLSGGQKQRCAIARAILRRPAVLLLDEATSALDSASEQVVQQALDAARQGRTTFTIAHRLSTIKDSDLILVVASGRISESGTHDELLTAQGVYAQLYSQGQGTA